MVFETIHIQPMFANNECAPSVQNEENSYPTQKTPEKPGFFAFIPSPLTQRQDDLVILRQLTHIEDGIAHAPQGCINTDTGDIGNLFET